MSDLIRRHNVLIALHESGLCYNNWLEVRNEINAIPSAEAETVDCTDFIRWLTETVMDEGNWELNAVAYGEVIARKLKKLGLLEVKNGCYIRHIENNATPSDLVYRPSADRPTGEWIDADGNNVPLDKDGYPLRSCCCNQCHEWLVGSDEYYTKGNFCPNCGADMRHKGGDGE